MHKKILPIKGMHCRSCEFIIEDKLRSVPGIKGVSVSLSDKQATIISKKPIDQDLVKSAVESAGYTIGEDEKKPWFSKDASEYFDLSVIFIIVLALYFFVKESGLINLNISSSGEKSLPIVLAVGLTAGFSTCMALVGGLILGISARHAEKHPDATRLQNFRPHIFFNIGRVASYFLLGGIIGFIGKGLQLSNLALGIMTMGVGVVMFILGAQLTEISPKISSFSFSMPSSVSRFFGIKRHQEKEYSHRNSMFLGALTFFLPCGFTQAMQLYALSTGSFFSGALIMSVFALGTVPGLLGIGGLASLFRGKASKYFFKFAGVLVVFLSLFNFTNGFNLTGWSLPSFSSSAAVKNISDPNVTIEDGVQVVHMSQKSYGYEPNRFIIKKGIPVKWVIQGEDPYSCSSSLIMPKMGIRKYLDVGENIIEFTPDDSGTLKFSCGMGMYTGQFDVTEQ